MATRILPTTSKLLIESLESRFNLSTLAGGSIVALRGAIAKPSLTQTLKNKKSPITLATTTNTLGATAFGATTLSSTAATSLDITAPSTLKGAQLETINGKPDIGYVATSGVDIEYTVTAPAAGTYSLSLGIAAPTSGSLSLAVNGSSQATYSWSSTNDWQKYTTLSKTITLSAGTNIIKLTPNNASQFNLNALTLTPATLTVTPATTTTTTTSTSKITAVGSSAVSLSIPNYSAINQSSLEYLNGTPDIGYVSSANSYVEYTLNVASAGNYNISLGTAGTYAAKVNLLVNGSQSATYTTSKTNSWSSFSSSSNSVYLPAGTVTLRFASADGTPYNIGSINIAPASTTTTTTTTSTSSQTTTSSTGTFDASVNTQWMTSFNQLNITAGSANDTINVSQSGSTIYVTVNGVTNSYTGSYGDIVVKAGSGADNITVNSSVNIATLLYGGSGNDTLKNLTTGNATIVSIGGGTDTVTGNGSNTAYWVDASDLINASTSEKSAGDVHAVSAFYNGASTTLAGQDLTDPSGTGTTTTIPNASLWGTGPSMSDINQGQVADCFLLAPLQTMANSNAAALRQTAVDLGDGTYAVQFKRNGVTTYVRVDGQLPSSGYYANGLMYAHPGSSGTIWAEVIEKAYAEFRSGANTYSSLNWGYIGSTFADLGVSYTAFGAGSTSTLYSTIANAIGSGKGVTVGTNASISANAPLVGSHCYSVTAAWTDSSGTQWVTLRNPWGYDGAGSDSNTADALVSMTISQLNANLSTGTIT